MKRQTGLSGRSGAPAGAANQSFFATTFGAAGIAPVARRHDLHAVFVERVLDVRVQRIQHHLSRVLPFEAHEQRVLHGQQSIGLGGARFAVATVGINGQPDVSIQEAPARAAGVQRRGTARLIDAYVYKVRKAAKVLDSQTFAALTSHAFVMSQPGLDRASPVHCPMSPAPPIGASGIVVKASFLVGTHSVSGGPKTRT